jgi:Right handed beta helix region
MNTQRCGRRILPLVFCVAASLAPAFGTDVTVGCPGGIGGQFTSINDALNSLDQFGPHTITVSGTCTENLLIHDRDGIAMFAAAGQTATIVNAAAPPQIVIQFFRARRMSLNGFVVQGGTDGVLVNEDSDVNIQNSTMQNNSGDGFVVQEGASADIENSTFQQNGGSGITAAAHSTLTLATFPTQRIRSTSNGYTGINVDGSFLQVNFGTVTIEHNAGPAILVTGGRLLIFGDGNLYQDNGEGVDLFNGSSALFFGQNLIRNNGAVGLQVDGSSADFLGGTLQNGTPDGTVIEGHTLLGANITGSSEVTFNGAHKIHNNGSSGGDPEFLSGIRISRSSTTLEGGTQVANNVGPGILADFSSGLEIIPDVSILQNGQGGIHLLHMSVAELAGPSLIIQSISCDSTSLLFGNLSGDIIDCKNAEPATSAVHPTRGLRH